MIRVVQDGLNEADLRMGLPSEALAEMEACLLAALPVAQAAHTILTSINSMMPFVEENQARLARLPNVIARMGRLAALKGGARVKLLDDMLDALDGAKIVLLHLGKIFVLTPEQEKISASLREAWGRCYQCFKVVEVGYSE